ncbi:hypothetical protein BDA96_07G222300 [Sorghum bicolor]|uniref:Uncharacterized protein n=2 Tax=Sorghum bicolor TaxID=4558 RepID=A0A921UAR8_SORBI|nr:uncharacterized protein LOC8055173 [Sorghum bicolor]EES14262.1 hypothetical protein SORBI_3007G209400 [Sorghum bicolor]KAG0524563.1 hypothetical protein BDA96_07G222300 [Sorghum bicolor]|eukprot:XP_002444767.1 uncharacterized protein LOC8055173 [Sorghum bicolor]
MKASIKFRDDERPLMRAKVPIAVLGLPFQSGLAAGGDPRELRFDVSTAFASGPALRLSYRPNDPALPFALTVRAGLGPLGSPARAPFALAAEFNLLAPDPSSSPAFFLRLKPRLGDFSLSHTLRSPAAPAAPAPRKVGEPGSDDGGHGRETKLLDYRPQFTFTGSGLAADVAAAGTKSGVGALLSGMRLTTRSVLPLWGRASLRFNWGLRVPPELLADDADGKGARAPVSKMPLLVMSKISIEQSPRAGTGSKCARAEAEASASASDSDGDAAFSLVRQQLESLNVENILLRRAVEDLRAEVRSSSRAARPAAAAAGRGEGRVTSTALQTQPHPRPQPYHATKPSPVRGAATAREPAAAPDDVGEELKKALEARLR